MRTLAFVAFLLVLTACGNATAMPGYNPAIAIPVGTSTPAGLVAESTFIAAQVTNSNATTVALAATGAVFDAQEAQATANARDTQEAVNVQLTLDANDRLNDAATDAAQVVATGTARAEARETATANAANTANAQAAVSATNAGAVLATAQKLSTEKKEQDLAEQALWLQALAGILNNTLWVCTIAAVILGIAAVLFGLAWLYLALRRRWLKDKQLEIAGMGNGTYRQLVAGQWVVEHYPTPPVTIVDPEPELEPGNPDAHFQAWRIATLRFLIGGDRYGFGIRDLGSAGQSIISNDGWREMTEFLKAHHILKEGRIDGRKGLFTIWGDGWSLQKFKQEQHLLQLPYPESDPPGVQIVPHSTTAQHSTTALVEVVE